jgi:hypothetical protein
MNNLQMHGIAVDVEVSNAGVRVVKLESNEAVCLMLNGKVMVPQEPKAGTNAKFWQPDGTQGESTIDLRGEN